MVIGDSDKESEKPDSRLGEVDETQPLTEAGEVSVSDSTEAPSKGTPETDKDKPMPPLNQLLGRLKDYKEFVAILVFFLGGLLWVYGVFATQKQVDQIKCLLNTNISLIHNQTQSRFLLQELTSKQLSLAEVIERGNAGTPHRGDRRLALQLETEIDLLKDKVKDAEDASAESLDLLKKSACDDA
ncbi:hypothetical protein [Tropicimonas sp. IMCC34043]|uniref:hypothetical protein n=1 Tax=Tropicimonas sp. IMCC34043 TaxID=2248760 RepID=UPI0013007BA5|nr:hypothetical protein [Tropicimonas sp. IMCC34043]